MNELIEQMLIESQASCNLDDAEMYKKIEKISVQMDEIVEDAENESE